MLLAQRVSSVDNQLTKMTDFEIQSELEFNRYLRETYKQLKVQYDPFEVFNPPVTFVTEIITELKHKAYAILQSIQEVGEDPVWGWVREELEVEHKKVVGRVKSHEYRLRLHKRFGTYSLPANTGLGGKITNIDINQAKEVPLRDHYHGTLKRSGRRLFGQCPFHNEKTGSFVIYEDQNSFHCYGCSANGDSIAYIMKLHNLKFVEAVRYLLNK